MNKEISLQFNINALTNEWEKASYVCLFKFM